MPQDQHAAPSVSDLTRPEHLLVWALRAMAFGQVDNPIVGQTFETACGPEGGEALGAFFALVHCLGFSARRRLSVHAPGCHCLASDERAVVALVAAAQDSLSSHDETLARARLDYLVRPDSVECCLLAAQQVARVLADNGLTLPLNLDAHDGAARERPPFRPRLVH